LNKILNNYSNSVALDGNPESDLVHAAGCKQPSLRKKQINNNKGENNNIKKTTNNKTRKRRRKEYKKKEIRNQ
jgi:hypothetical protein